MSINGNFKTFDISSVGIKLQKKKLDLIAENIANSNTTKTPTGMPYKRKVLQVEEQQNFQKMVADVKAQAEMKITMPFQFPKTPGIMNEKKGYEGISMRVVNDNTPGERVYMPDHPDSGEEGYIDMPNVDIVTEMVDMVAATRSYEANLTAFSAAKQIAKDSLEI